MMPWSLLAINFWINLRMELRSEIGLKSFVVIGLLFFGTRVMKELLIACKLTFPEKKIAELINIFLYDVPTSFEEQSIESIRSRSFVYWHEFHYIVTFFLSEGC